MKQSKTRAKLESSRELILRIFDYRCIMCGAPTREVHEIIPISHGEIALAGEEIECPFVGMVRPKITTIGHIELEPE